MSENFSPGSLFDLSHTGHAEVFADGEPAWSALSRIGNYLAEKTGFAHLGNVAEGAFVTGKVHLGAGTSVEPRLISR